jgi:hopene-associated glycosyltransferase HpnB
MIATLLAGVALAIWIYLMTARGGFWLCAERDGGGPSPAVWPAITAVIPARDEAEGVGETVASLLRQDYPGPFTLLLVDDQSTDGTANVARRAAEAVGAGERLTVLPGAPLPRGWTGKLWAMKQGLDRASEAAPTFLLFTDADIVYAPDALRLLSSRAVSDHLVLASLMAKLRCDSRVEHALIPAFIFFFQMLYPFAWVNRRDRDCAAAAGGCMLVRREALEAAGGLESIRDALIDDCALARRLKAQGPIRLALTDRVTSIRPYPTLADARSMIARSAYAQLRYSPVLLAGTVAGLALTYLVPVMLAVFARGFPQYCGLATWVIMAVALQPTLAFYRLSPLWGLALPGIAFVYMAFTLDSAYQHAVGRGGFWKGRAQARATGPS